jgi:general L-amino acid transport system permease protein
VETFRNIPVLLQIFFWYYVVIRSLPQLSDSINIAGLAILNNRGLYLPSVALGSGWRWFALVVTAAVTLILIFKRYATKGGAPRKRDRLVARAYLGFVAGLGIVALACTDLLVTFSPPQAGRFNYSGGLHLQPELLAMWIGLSMYNASYIGEIVRSGFVSIPGGQWDAARALGLSNSQVIRRIAVPQALRVIIPPLTTVYLNIFKGSSLGVAIAYPEIASVFVGTVSNIVGQPLEIMAITLVFYVSVSLLMSLLMNRYNARAQIKE